MKHRRDIVNQPFLVRWGRWGGNSRPPAPILGFHSVVEIQLIKAGSARCLIGDRRHACERNTLLVIPPNTPHLFVSESLMAGEKWVLNFLPSLLQVGGQPWRLPRRTPHMLQLEETAAEEIESVLRLLLMEYERHRACHAECIAAALRYLMALINRASRGQQRPAPHNPIVSGVIASIEEGFLDDLTLSSLAGKAGYSPFYLAHLFKGGTGMSIRQYILQRRVAEARRLLAAEPALTIATVAERAGFGSYRVFCQAFRKFVRLPPAAYRRSCSERCAAADAPKPPSNNPPAGHQS